MAFASVSGCGVPSGWGWTKATTVNPYVALCASDRSFLSLLIAATMSAFQKGDHPKTDTINAIVGNGGKWNALSLGSTTFVAWIGSSNMDRKPTGL
jgi:hypothetical protein